VIVLVLTAVPPGLRGDLSRWLIEVAPGVFCGRVSRRVRDRLWDRVQAGVRGGSAVLVTASGDKEQGYEILTCGRHRWTPVDFDGLTLIEVPRRPRQAAAAAGTAGRRPPPRRRRSGRRPWTAAWGRLRAAAKTALSRPPPEAGP
jgi:CRISPR-associated protein Cas2